MVNPGDLITADLFNNMADVIEDLSDRIAKLLAAVKIDNGNVGIGTPSPIVPLHINGSADKGLKIGAQGKSTVVSLHVAGGDYGYLHLGGNTMLRGNGRPSYFDGNVGIGTTDPDTRLHIFGGKDASLKSDSGFLVVGSVVGANIVMDDNEIMARNKGEKSALHLQADGGDLVVHNHQDESKRFIIKDSGKVGIGTTGPEARLHVKDGDILLGNNQAVMFEDKDGTNHRILRLDGNNDVTLWNPKGGANDDIYFGTGPIRGSNIRMVVKGGGNVGIGTPKPDYALEIRKSVHKGFSVGTGGDGGRIWTEYLDASPNLIFYDMDDAGVIRFRQSPKKNKEDKPEYEAIIAGKNGNVGIGEVNPKYPLHMGDGAYCDGKRWIDVSSIEYKKDVAPLTLDRALETLAGLSPVTYRYEEEEEDEKHVGFIAEEVPELVATKERKGLNSLDMVGILTKVVQHLQKEIEELKARLNEEQ